MKLTEVDFLGLVPYSDFVVGVTPVGGRCARSFRVRRARDKFESRASVGSEGALVQGVFVIQADTALPRPETDTDIARRRTGW